MAEENVQIYRNQILENAFVKLSLSHHARLVPI